MIQSNRREDDGEGGKQLAYMELESVAQRESKGCAVLRTQAVVIYQEYQSCGHITLPRTRISYDTITNFYPIVDSLTNLLSNVHSRNIRENQQLPGKENSLQ